MANWYADCPDAIEVSEPPARGCFGKIGYKSAKEANQALCHIVGRRRERRADLNAYSCTKCGEWHLGRKGFKAIRRETARVPDHHPASLKSRKARYQELLK